MTRILLVLSGSDHWTLKDGSRHPTGYWAEEFVVPHSVFRAQGVDVAVATPGGVAPTVDQVSLQPEMAGGEVRAAAFRDYINASAAELARPMVLEHAVGRVAEYDAIYIPGGHGPMEDLVGFRPLGEILVQFFDTDRVVASVCHGPAGLLSADRPDGSWLFDGMRMTAFTNEEERRAGLAGRAPWLLEDRLRERGADFKAGPAWEPHVVVDGNLLTGQNPASSQAASSSTMVHGAVAIVFGVLALAWPAGTVLALAVLFGAYHASVQRGHPVHRRVDARGGNIRKGKSATAWRGL